MADNDKVESILDLMPEIDWGPNPWGPGADFPEPTDETPSNGEASSKFPDGPGYGDGLVVSGDTGLLPGVSLTSKEPELPAADNGKVESILDLMPEIDWGPNPWGPGADFPEPTDETPSNGEASNKFPDGPGYGDGLVVSADTGFLPHVSLTSKESELPAADNDKVKSILDLMPEIDWGPNPWGPGADFPEPTDETPSNGEASSKFPDGPGYGDPAVDSVQSNNVGAAPLYSNNQMYHYVYTYHGDTPGVDVIEGLTGTGHGSNVALAEAGSTASVFSAEAAQDSVMPEIAKFMKMAQSGEGFSQNFEGFDKGGLGHMPEPEEMQGLRDEPQEHPGHGPGRGADWAKFDKSFDKNTSFENDEPGNFEEFSLPQHDYFG